MKESVVLRQHQHTIQKLFEVYLAAGSAATEMIHFGADLGEGIQDGGIPGKQFVSLVLQTQTGQMAQATLYSAADPLLHRLGTVAKLGTQGTDTDL